MQYGVCLLSLVPCRKEPSGTSEMVTQLLFGEQYQLLSGEKGWLRIRCAADGYECWISEKQHSPLSQKSFQELRSRKPFYAQELVQVIHNKRTQSSFPITIGATLPFLKEHAMSFDSYEFSYEGTSTQVHKGKANDIIASCFLFLNAPYLWGGRSPFGIDCSGLSQMAFRLNGYELPRDSAQQAEEGEALSFVEEAGAGDLAFFDNEAGRITHVGILLGNGQIIHASGCVRIDKLDHYGIFNTDTRKYSHNLRVIKRIID